MKKLMNSADDFVKEMDNLCAANALLLLYIRIQAVLYDNENSLNKRLISELIANHDYYALFGIDYYYELSRTDGLSASLEELESDVNSRVSTYMGTAYKEYKQLVPEIYLAMEEALKAGRTTIRIL